MSETIKVVAISLVISVMALSCAWCSVEQDKSFNDLTKWKLAHNCHTTNYWRGEEACQ